MHEFNDSIGFVVNQNIQQILIENYCARKNATVRAPNAAQHELENWPWPTYRFAQEKRTKLTQCHENAMKHDAMSDLNYFRHPILTDLKDIPPK